VGVRFDRPPRPGWDSSFLVVFQRIATSPSRVRAGTGSPAGRRDGLLGGRGMRKSGAFCALGSAAVGREIKKIAKVKLVVFHLEPGQAGRVLGDRGGEAWRDTGKLPSPPQTSRPGTGRSRSASPKPAAWPAWRPRPRPPGDRAAGAAEPKISTAANANSQSRTMDELIRSAGAAQSAKRARAASGEAGPCALQPRRAWNTGRQAR
jgi:hypothetical protein